MPQCQYNFVWAVTQNISITLAVSFYPLVAGLSRLGSIVNIIIYQIRKAESKVNSLALGKIFVIYLTWFDLDFENSKCHCPIRRQQQIYQQIHDYLINLSGDWNIFLNEKVTYILLSIATRTSNMSFQHCFPITVGMSEWLYKARVTASPNMSQTSQYSPLIIRLINAHTLRYNRLMAYAQMINSKCA